MISSKPQRFWSASGNRIYSFESAINASDNGRQAVPAQRFLVDHNVQNLSIYEFADNGELQSLYQDPHADWQGGIVEFSSVGRKISIVDGRVITTDFSGGTWPLNQIRSRLF